MQRHLDRRSALFGVTFSLVFGAAQSVVADPHRCSAKWWEQIRKERDLLEQKALLEQALKECPDDALHQRRYAYALERLRRYPEALDRYQRAIELDPADEQAHQGLGDVAVNLGRLALAVKAYEKSLELDPNNRRVEFALRATRTQLKAEVGQSVSAGQIKDVLTRPPPTHTGEDSMAGPKLRLRVNFAYGAMSLNKRARGNLDAVGRALGSAELKDARFELRGHTDSTGSAHRV